MRILYISLSYVPSRRASAVQVVKTCAAFAAQGHDVALVTKHCRERIEPNVDDDFAFYGVPRSFELVKLPRPIRRGGGGVYAARVAQTVWSRRKSVDLAYCRDMIGAAIVAGCGIPFIFEAHGVPEQPWLVRLWRRVLRSRHLVRVVAISQALADEIRARDLAPAATRIVVAHDAADPPPHAARPDARPGARFAAGYVGNLYPGRGVETIFALAAAMPEVDFHIVGGQTADIERWQATERRDNVHFHGFVPPAQLRRFYDTFDAVLMPYGTGPVRAASGGDIRRWMSPMKMFEYMASGVPIVSADVSVLREVLRDRHNSLLVEAGNVDAWRRALLELAGSPALRERLAANATADLVSNYTWDARARRVLADAR